MKLTFQIVFASLCWIISASAQDDVHGALRSANVADITFVSFDVETTGLSPATERIIEYGAIKFKSDATIEEKSWLINPRRRITLGARKVHGITHDMVKRERIFRTVYPEIMSFIDGTVLLAHNARFDINFFTAEMQRNDKPLPNAMIIDTLPLFRKWFPDAPAHNLTALADYLGVSGGEFHRGMSDAAYVVQIFQIGMKRPGAPETVEQLIKQAGGSYLFTPKLL